jgi:hypothetical protein
MLAGHAELLVNARHWKTVPGRKTDVKDSEWIRGKKRASVAVGHTILVTAYDIWQDAVEYHDLGGDHCDRLRHERTVSHVVSHLQRLGYRVALEAIEPQAA